MKKHGCALLAGGAGNRMGGMIKANLILEKRSFLDRISSELKASGLPCYLSLAAYELTVPEGFTAVPDAVKDPSGSRIGPMGGIFSCLSAARGDGLDGLIFVPCDAPFFNMEMISRLLQFLEKAPDCDAAVFRTSDGTLHPLFGYYSANCLPVLDSEIRNSHYKIKDFLKKIRTTVISAESAGLPDALFSNINTEWEYRALQNEARAVPLEEAVRYLQENTVPITATLRLPIAEASGYSLAEDIYARINQPPFPRSPFDGYAVRSEDTGGASRSTPVTLSVTGEVDAGGWFEETVCPGEAVRIMTGAPIPEGADAVIKQEDTDYGERDVRIFRQMAHHQNYVFSGEDFKKGELLLKKGEHLGPVEIGILAGNGITEVSVYRRPRILVISTGSELKKPGETLSPGQIYDSNLYTIAMQLKAWGCEVPAMLQVADEPEKCENLIRQWKDRADLIVTTGGVSVGKKDIMHDVYSALKLKRIFWKVSIKPGAAMMAGKVQDTMILSLSGNPYAAYINLHLLVRQVLASMTGNRSLEMVRLRAVLADDYDRNSPVRRFVRCRVQDQKVHLEGHTGGNGDIASGRHINGLVDLPAGSGSKKAGDPVTVLLL